MVTDTFNKIYATQRLTVGRGEQMEKDFKVIETQEQLDSILKDRLERAEKAAAKQYEGYTSPDDLNALKETHKKELEELHNKYSAELEKYKDVDEQLRQKDETIHAYEISSVKNNVARELDLPFEAIEFLQGSNEKEIKESAEKLKSMTGNKHIIAPIKDREESQEDTLTRAYKDVLSKLGQ